MASLGQGGKGMISFVALAVGLLWVFFWEWLRNLDRNHYKSTQWMVLLSSIGFLIINLVGLFFTMRANS